jgi:hypothetical protein
MAHGIFGVMRVPPEDAAPGAEGRDHFDLPIAALTEADVFKARRDERLTWRRDAPPAQGHARVVFPGLMASEAAGTRGCPPRPSPPGISRRRPP